MALTKAEIAEALFDQLGLNKRDARELVDLFFEELRAALSTAQDAVWLEEAAAHSGRLDGAA